MKLQLQSITKHFPLVATVIGILSGGIGIWSFFSSGNQMPAITGVWTITLDPETSKVKDYEDDVYVFEVYVVQKGDKVTGIGEQTLYNGNSAKKHFKMTFHDLKFDDDQLIVIYKQEDNRGTEGILTLKFDENNSKSLSGTYSASVADTKGLVKVEIK